MCPKKRRRAIRRAVQENPKATVNEIVQLLKAQGIDVNPRKIVQLRMQQQAPLPAAKARTIAPTPQRAKSASKRQAIRQTTTRPPARTQEPIPVPSKNQGVEARSQRTVPRQHEPTGTSRVGTSKVAAAQLGVPKHMLLALDEIKKHGDSIRKAIIANLNVSPRQLLQILKEQGIKVQLFSVIRVRREMEIGSKTSLAEPFPGMRLTRKFVRDVGGIEIAQNLLEELKKVRDSELRLTENPKKK